METISDSNEMPLNPMTEYVSENPAEKTVENQNEISEVNQVIKPINQQTVHRICSGQVVLTLAVAVKELVENALDAGATIIEVKLKEYGSELVEVVDNGFGVLKENFAALTLKHYTSKIRQFSDLEFVETLGFRGEALSSLCALSKVTITTRHSSASVATKIVYDHNGKITNESTAPRSQGTTVSLTNLFCTLPVRRKEFLKNLKREFSKMCQLLFAYCLISSNVKIICTNQLTNGKKSTIVTTQGLNSVRDNIINVFGAKQISSLIEVSAAKPIEDVLREYGIEDETESEQLFKFVCFISSVTHGSGRSISDRQFFYVNSRPCEPTKIIKLVNEVYRQYNGNQYPFVFLNILTERNHIDVNVTPDKRQIFLQKEKVLLACLKSSLLEAFKNFPSTYAVQNLDITTDEKKNLNQSTINNNLKGLKRGISNVENNSSVSVLDIFRKKPKKDDESFSVNEISQIFNKNYEENQNNKTENGSTEPINCNIIGENVTMRVITADLPNLTTLINPGNNIGLSERINDEIKIENDNGSSEGINDEIKIENNDKSKMEDDRKTGIETECETVNNITDNQFKIECEVKCEEENKVEIIDCKLIKDEITTKENIIDLTSTLKFDDKRKSALRVEHILDASLQEIRFRLKKQRENRDEIKTAKVLFRTEISPLTNQAAEEELQKQISKDKFKQMEVIGQFNLGFIIAKLEHDLFIIDQHAADEKYNFEQLQAHTMLETQKLVNPKPLNLTAANETLLIENEAIFKKNGFTFSIDLNAEPTKKVKLTSIPLSKNYVFGKDDIDELLYILQETAQTMCRPSRVRQMFAMRACRKSVMVGKALAHSDMRRLIDHMEEIEQPWNCPHGRPTMRHLINLSLLKLD